MDDKYILTFFSEYLNCREKFIYSRVSKLWNEGMKKGKKEFIVKEVEKMRITHILQNLCPCFLGEGFKKVILNYDLKKNICKVINNENPPRWLNKYC